MSEIKRNWNRMPKGARIVSMVVLGLVTAIVFGFVFGIVVKALWNWLMPELFGLKTITYWQAFGLVILGHLLVGSSGGSHGGESKKTSRKNRRCEPPAGEEDSRDNWKHWKYYDEWWQSEGKNAFRDFVDKKEDGESGSPDQP